MGLCQAKRLARVGRIFTMVEGMGYAFADGSEGRRRFLRAVQQPLYRLAFSLSNATFVLNPDDRDLLRQRGLARRQRVQRPVSWPRAPATPAARLWRRTHRRGAAKASVAASG